MTFYLGSTMHDGLRMLPFSLPRKYPYGSPWVPQHAPRARACLYHFCPLVAPPVSFSPFFSAYFAGTVGLCFSSLQKATPKRTTAILMCGHPHTLHPLSPPPPLPPLSVVSVVICLMTKRSRQNVTTIAILCPTATSPTWCAKKYLCACVCEREREFGLQ